jgi:hypothetical protein
MGVPVLGLACMCIYGKKNKGHKSTLTTTVPRPAKTFIPFLFHLVNIFEEPPTRARWACINREKAIIIQEKKSKNNNKRPKTTATTKTQDPKPSEATANKDTLRAKNHRRCKIEGVQPVNIFQAISVPSSYPN